MSHLKHFANPLFILPRRCVHCGRILPKTEFYRKGDGLQSWCIDCCKERGKLRNGSTGVYRDPEQPPKWTIHTKQTTDTMTNRKHRNPTLTGSMEPDQITIHNTSRRHQITVSKYMSDRIWATGLEWASIRYADIFQSFDIVFSKDLGDRALTIRRKGNICLNLSNDVKRIARSYKLRAGIFRLNVTMVEENDKRIVLRIKRPTPANLGPFDIARQQEAKERQRQRLENFTADRTPDIDTCIRVLKAAGYKVMRQEWTEV